MTTDTPREIGRQFVTLGGLPGAEDLANHPDAPIVEETIARFVAQGRHVGWNQLKQADFDAIQAALDGPDAPRRKRQNPTVWKIRFWWHWHITDPIIYPILHPIADLFAHLFMPRTWRVALDVDGDAYAVEQLGLVRYLRRRLWAARRDITVEGGRGVATILRTDRMTALDYRFIFGVAGPIEGETCRPCRGRDEPEGREVVGYGWHCAPCKINAGHPDDPFPTLEAAELAFQSHVEQQHDGVTPVDAEADEIAWYEPAA